MSHRRYEVFLKCGRSIVVKGEDLAFDLMNIISIKDNINWKHCFNMILGR